MCVPLAVLLWWHQDASLLVVQGSTIMQHGMLLGWCLLGCGRAVQRQLVTWHVQKLSAAVFKRAMHGLAVTARPARTAAATAAGGSS
jgi:hypothetical protein